MALVDGAASQQSAQHGRFKRSMSRSILSIEKDRSESSNNRWCRQSPHALLARFFPFSSGSTSAVQTPRQPKHTRLASTDPASIDSPFSKAPPTHPPTHPPTDLRGPFKRLPIFKQLKCRRHIFSCERARTPPSALAIFRLLSFGQALGGRHRDGGWNDRGRCCSASPQYNSFYPLRSMGSANPD